jgi:hypothetical protein
VKRRPQTLRNAPAIALALLSLLVTAACSAAPATAPVTEPVASSPSGGLADALPKPNAAQEEALLAALARINPRYSTEEAVDRARSLCGRLLGLSPADQLLAAAKTAFTSGDAPAVSDEDAQRILTVIGANGFCR